MFQEYGPGPGGETIEERRLREARELEERERRLREIEEMRNRKVTVLPTHSCQDVIMSCHIHFVFQPDEDDSFRHHMLKIKSTMEIAPEKAYCV